MMHKHTWLWLAIVMVSVAHAGTSENPRLNPPPRNRVVIDGRLSVEVAIIKDTPATTYVYKMADTKTSSQVEGLKSYLIFDMAEQKWKDLFEGQVDSVKTRFRMGVEYRTVHPANSVEEENDRYTDWSNAKLTRSLVPGSSGVLVEAELPSQYMVNINNGYTGKLTSIQGKVSSAPSRRVGATDFNAFDVSSLLDPSAIQVDESENSENEEVEAGTEDVQRMKILIPYPMATRKVTVTRDVPTGRTEYPVLVGWQGPGGSKLISPVRIIDYGHGRKETRKVSEKIDQNYLSSNAVGPASAKDVSQVCLLVSRTETEEKRLCWTLFRSSTDPFVGNCPPAVTKRLAE